MSPSDDQMREAAIAWYLRLREPADADWDGFMAWLEADPRHDALYQEVADAHDGYGDLVEAVDAHRPSNDNVQTNPRRLKFFAGIVTAAAASVAGIVGYPMLTASPATYAVETQPGQHQTVRLDDGTRIELNGDTKIMLRKGDARFTSLDRGEATFTVVHDASDPFEVHVGADVYQDAGTVFDITRDNNGAVETAVSHGAVLYNPGSDAVRIEAGRVLRTDRGRATLASIDTATVGTWRDGRLIYKQAPIARIASDVSRNLGVPIRVSPDIAAQTFSGVVILGGDDSTILPRIGAILDISVAREADGWHMSSRARDSR
ncbi:FecR family protein [Sphingomonas montanisoli]|uniref:DUF4880 domain-containing protein n=1 Tax=Sphingomonas montanisoli TaxID=2606412 RepID=A0A5D9C858_9SPHN|nr:FecR domain-containing protein [Sphingomonas montanisoli]TZG28068.1 DUF4880 domain-containing protein [Sphingomonas montanisoli]